MTKEVLKRIVNAIEDKKAERVKVLDISLISVMADVFVITSGSNTSQLEAITDAAHEAFTKEGIDFKSEGDATSGWVLIDAGDIILHIFSREARDFYDLERIWKDGAVIEL